MLSIPLERQEIKFVNPYREKIKEYPGRLFTFEDFDADLLSLKVITTCAQGIFCELGSGSGRHLIKQAQLDPGNLYIGIELRYKRAYRTIQKAVNKNVDNLLVLRTNASNLEHLFSLGSLNGIYINFPDPWEKRKVRKHRLVSEAFLDVTFGLLRPGGFISFKTDHKEYYQSFFDLLSGDSRFCLRSQTEDLYNSQYVGDNIETEFECLFRSQNLPICFLLAHKL